MPMDFSKTKHNREKFDPPCRQEYEIAMILREVRIKRGERGITGDAPSYEEWVAEKRRAFESATPSTPARRASVERELQALLREIEKRNEERRREYRSLEDVEP